MKRIFAFLPDVLILGGLFILLYSRFSMETYYFGRITNWGIISSVLIIALGIDISIRRYLNRDKK